MKHLKGVELKHQEEIIGLVRQSILALPFRVVFALFFLLLPFLLLFPLLTFGPIGFIVLFVLLIFGALNALRSWFIWKNSMFLITNLRIIDIDQEGLFRRDISSVFYRDVKSVDVFDGGFLYRIFGLGNVRVRTVSSFSYDVELIGVAQSQNVANLIDEVQLITSRRSGSEPFHVKNLLHEKEDSDKSE